MLGEGNDENPAMRSGYGTRAFGAIDRRSRSHQRSIGGNPIESKMLGRVQDSGKSTGVDYQIHREARLSIYFYYYRFL